MSEKLNKLLDEQIRQELISAYLYYDIANYYKKNGLDGFYNYFEKQAAEEVRHAQRFISYMQDRDIDYKLKVLDAPNTNFTDLRQPLVEALEHEILVTGQIKTMYLLAQKEDDLNTKNFLEWFVDEQMDEERDCKALIAEFDLIKEFGGDIMGMDKKLSKREI